MSGFLFVPLTVLFVSVLLGSLAMKANPLSPSSVDSPPAASSSISPIFRIEVQYWADSISKWAAASQLDPNLVATIMQIESCGDPRARSSAGAMGLFQVMPFHFYAVDDPYDPDTNAARGLAYLARSLATGGGDARLAMAGYNGGIGVISRAEWTWHAQTKRYVQYGAPMYEDARNGINPSPALNDWYEKYGVSLCRQASQRLGLP
ncbi:MAG: transglycosylase SLT domain-containing protein [Chloroflexi bacterium]|nr:transglycosylase SLT domain-containing protein [Chloroflexota bacterium]